MDFSIPEMHNDIKTLATTLLADYSAADRLKKLEKQGPYFDKEVWQKMVETGIHAASLPESLGGMGMDYMAASIVCEALGKTLVSIPYIPCIISTALPLLAFQANAAVAESLQAVVNGETIITTAMIEPGNENPLNPKTIVNKVGDTFQLNGQKHCVPYAADSSKVMVSALNNNTLWVGLVSLNAKGLSMTTQYCTSNEPQYLLQFNDVEAIEVAQGDAAIQLMHTSMAMTLTAYCSMASGVADKMTRIAAEYTSQRQQFGVPIATFQSVAHRLSNAYIDTECLKIITLKAASDINQGDINSEAVSMAKVWCGDVLHRVSQSSQHVHGGTGIDRDYHLFRYCLWAKQLELSLGNSRTHLVQIADRLAAKYLATV